MPSLLNAEFSQQALTIAFQHSKGHWCWTNAELESLKSQAAQNLEWSTIAKVSQLSIVLLFIRHYHGFDLNNKKLDKL